MSIEGIANLGPKVFFASVRAAQVLDEIGEAIHVARVDEYVARGQYHVDKVFVFVRVDVMQFGHARTQIPQIRDTF